MATALDILRTSQGQNPTGPPDMQDWLDQAADLGTARLDRYALHERYYTGDQQVPLTDRLAAYLEANGVPWAENFCEPMVDMVAERLTVVGFEATLDTTNPDEDDNAGDTLAGLISEWLADVFWSRGRLEETQNTVHTIALAKGDAFGIVGWDNATQRPTFSYNPPERMKVVYDDDDGAMAYAVKKWDTATVGPSNPHGRNVTRLNVYWPDRIEKWFKLHNSTGRGGWAKWADPPTGDQPAAWPTPWVDADGTPLGIPVAHFRNRPLGDDYGRSELLNVIPQQNELNKQVLDLNAILDAQGWPQRWIAGAGTETGQIKMVPGEVWKSGDKDTKYGQFPSADLAPVLAAIESTISRMARRSGMPLHLLTGGAIPSGEAMKTAESRLVARVKDRQASYGNAWEDAARVALRLAQLAGVGPADVDMDALALSATWANPASRDEYAEAQTAEAHHRLGASKHTLLTKLGYDPIEEAELRDAEAMEAQARMQTVFDRDLDPDGGPPRFPDTQTGGDEDGGE